MRKVKIYCDACKKEIENCTSITFCDPVKSLLSEYDLCRSCFKEIKDMIDKKLNK